IYPHGPGGERHRLLLNPQALVRNLTKTRIRKDLAGIAGEGAYAQSSHTGPCLLLDELKPITRDDVLEWFSLHNILETEEQRLKTAASIFTGHGSMSLRKSMAEIETHLRNVQHAFLLER